MKTTNQSRTDQKTTPALEDNDEGRSASAGDLPEDIVKDTKVRTTLCQPAILDKSDDDDDDDD